MPSHCGGTEKKCYFCRMKHPCALSFPCRLAVLLVALALTVGRPAFAAAKETADFTVAIDPGHGGNDKGCHSGRTYEKDVTLDVAKRLQKLINKAFGDSVKTVMTRSTDVFVPLDKRARIANDAAADLFISIHVNSIDARNRNRHNIHGASVYTVGLHKSDANLQVAMRENAVIELEEDFSAVYQGFDPTSSESYIIFELGQNRNMEQSIAFADLAQRELVQTAGRADKGVRQAGCLVLWATGMPAVIVELVFTCNINALAFPRSEAGC